MPDESLGLSGWLALPGCIAVGRALITEALQRSPNSSRPWYLGPQARSGSSHHWHQPAEPREPIMMPSDRIMLLDGTIPIDLIPSGEVFDTDQVWPNWLTFTQPIVFMCHTGMSSES